jgi:hypothetical protein
LRGKKRVTERIIAIVLLAFVIFLCIWAVSIIRCEILTALRGNEFTYGYKQTNMLDGEMDQLKVLDYSDTTARVYYIDWRGGDILHFTKKGAEWVYDGWETVWSKTGTADDVIWPYLWLSAYGPAYPLLFYGIPVLIIMIILAVVLIKKRKAVPFNDTEDKRKKGG